MKIEAVILYSTNDYRFFRLCVQNLLDLGVSCHVVTFTHMWNGTPESTDLLSSSEQIFEGNPKVSFYKIQWDIDKDPWFWESTGRHLATQRVSADADYLLYIDIDEIVDVKIFEEWLSSGLDLAYDTIKLACNWYWREPIYQAGPEYNTILAKSSLAKALPLTRGGREIYFECSSNRQLTDPAIPLIDHYSWVRSKYQMLQKVKNWGHAGDRSDWVQCVEEEFSRPFNGTCFLNNYTFTTVDNRYQL